MITYEDQKIAVQWAETILRGPDGKEIPRESMAPEAMLPSVVTAYFVLDSIERINDLENQVRLFELDAEE